MPSEVSTVTPQRNFASSTVSLAHLIGGEWKDGTPSGSHPNPSDLSDIVFERVEGSAADIDQAVGAARAAFERWQAPPAKRSALLAAISARIRRNAQHLAAQLAREEGKLLSDAQAEVAKAADIVSFYAGLALQLSGQFGQRLASNAEVIVSRDPRGVVGLITPWNAPLMIAAWKLAPALMMGNAVVLKPSGLAPVCVQSLISLVRDCLEEVGAPLGLVNMVHSSRGAGDALVNHPGIDALSFTGSLALGQQLARTVAERLLPLQLELGGKNGFVVAADADLEDAARLCIAGAFAGAGQRCTATSRVIVEAPVADKFIEILAEGVSRLKVGHAFAPGVDLGPVITPAALERIEGMIGQACRSGASRLASGSITATSQGHYCAPALVLDDDPHSHINQEEVFGPVASIIRVTDLDAAIAVANGTRFGLSSGISTRSLSAARRFRRESVAGIVAVNQITSQADLSAPFEGTRLSGFGGAEQGTEGPRFFSRVKAAYIDG